MEEIGTKNDPPFFVEFGYCSRHRGEASNTVHLELNKGWRGLLLDGKHFNPVINLCREFITSDNIVQIFEKHSVPDEPDYVSIDIDTCDLWVMQSLISAPNRRGPRLVSVEYNSHFLADQFITFPDDPNEFWERDRVYGASLAALQLMCSAHNYRLVDVVPPADAFFVRGDLMGDLGEIRDLTPYCNIQCQPACTSGREKIMLDYHVLLASGQPDLARRAASEAWPQLTEP